MTEKECRDWLEAAGARLKRPAAPLLRYLGETAPQAPGARWEVCLDSAPGLSTLGVRCFLPTAERFPLSWAVADLACGRSEKGLPGGLRWEHAGPTTFASPELAPFRDFAALHPVAGIVSETGAWSLRLKRPAPWPSFCASTLIKPFASQSGLAADLAGALAVREARFSESGCRLWLSAA